MPNLRIDAVKCCKNVGQRVADEWREKLLGKLREKASPPATRLRPACIRVHPRAPSLQPRAPSVQPHAPSLPPHAMRQAWRRSSAEMLSHVISTASSSQQLTECRLTLVDLAGSEDVGRSGAASIVKEPWLAFARLATRRSRGL